MAMSMMHDSKCFRKHRALPGDALSSNILLTDEFCMPCLIHAWQPGDCSTAPLLPLAASMPDAYMLCKPLT